MRSAEPLRGVGIGAGYFAPFHYEAWTRIPEVQITAVCDVAEDRARRVVDDFGVARFYQDWKQAIDQERPDFVDIITPPDTHEEICAYAVERGVHIVCQKPLAPSLEEARRLAEQVRSASVRAMVHENFRWQPWYRVIKDIRSAGTIGDFTHLYFRMRTGDGWGADAYLARQPVFRHYPRLLFYETGVHFIDTFRFLMGEVVSVYAQMRRLNPVIRGEDTGQLFLTFANGSTAIWDANRYNETEAASPRYTFGTLRIDGTKGHLVMNTEGAIRTKILGEPSTDVPYAHAQTNFAGDCVYFTQRHFVDSLLSGEAFETSFDDYLRTTSIVDAAYLSVERGAPVLMPAAGDDAHD